MNPDDLSQLEELLSSAFDQIGNYEPPSNTPVSITPGPAPVDTGMEGPADGQATNVPVGGFQPWQSPGGGYGAGSNIDPATATGDRPQAPYTPPSDAGGGGDEAPAGPPPTGGSRSFAGQSFTLPSSAGFGRGPDNVGLGDIGNPEDNYSFDGPSNQKYLGGFLEEVLTGSGGGVLGDALRSAFGGIQQASRRADVLDNPGMEDSLRGVRGPAGLTAQTFVDDVKRNNLIEVRPETDGNGSLYQRFRYEAGNTDDRLLRYGPEKPPPGTGRPNGGIPYRRDDGPTGPNLIDVNDLGQYQSHQTFNQNGSINGGTIPIQAGDTVIEYPSYYVINRNGEEWVYTKDGGKNAGQLHYPTDGAYQLNDPKYQSTLSQGDSAYGPVNPSGSGPVSNAPVVPSSGTSASPVVPPVAGPVNPITVEEKVLKVENGRTLIQKPNGELYWQSSAGLQPAGISRAEYDAQETQRAQDYAASNQNIRYTPAANGMYNVQKPEGPNGQWITTGQIPASQVPPSRR